MHPRVGTAGWSIPSVLADRLPGEGSHLARYAAGFNAVEINSSFHRPHRRATYERWAASTAPEFRFAIKLPRTITHDRRLTDVDDLVARFAGEVIGLDHRRGPILVQLPPSLALAVDVADRFFDRLRAALGGSIVCEPRHPSWFDEAGEALLERYRIARVAADPAPVPAAAVPGGWRGFAYFRLHGSPVIYRSAYGAAAVACHADVLSTLAARGVETWTIYDNTASGAATADALALRDRMRADR